MSLLMLAVLVVAVMSDVLNAKYYPPPGTVYTRWGRTTCPRGTELVYDGYTAGSHYRHRGGAAEPLCLPKNPDAGGHSHVRDRHYGFIYGAEYEVRNGAFFPGGRSILQHDVPCAVCRTNYRTSVIMVPGKNQCPGRGWRFEYRGFLMSGYYNHVRASKFSCVDGAPELLAGGHANHDGYLFYMVAAKCSSLKCPPYASDRVLVCVVCSK